MSIKWIEEIEIKNKDLPDWYVDFCLYFQKHLWRMLRKYGDCVLEQKIFKGLIIHKKSFLKHSIKNHIYVCWYIIEKLYQYNQSYLKNEKLKKEIKRLFGRVNNIMYPLCMKT